MAPQPTPRPAFEVTLEWLHALVGGPDALPTLSVDPHPAPRAPTLPDLADAGQVHETVSQQLERATEAHFGAEVGRILQDALGILWERDPEGTAGRAPNRTAAGLCWVVGRANHLFTGGITQTEVARTLWVRSALSSAGPTVLRCLREVWLHDPGRPPGAPDLLPTGDTRLLTSPTRRELVRWRDAAERARASILPQEVES